MVEEYTSSQEKQLFQKSCKILTINTTFAKFLQSIQLLQNSCNNFATITHFLQKFCKSCVSCIKWNFCKNLARSCKK